MILNKIFQLKLLLILFMFSGFCCYSQNVQLDNPEIIQLKEKIQGTWVLENDSTTKLVFNENDQVKEYSNDELISTKNYEITNSCDGESLNYNLNSDNTYFLKTYANGEENDPFCAYIEGIDCNDNGVLSLMTKNQGKIIVYQKQ